MNKSQLILWLTRLAWAALGLDLFLVVFIAPSVQSDNIVVLFLWLFGVALISLLAGTWLIIRYRHFFRSWVAWGGLIVITYISHAITVGYMKMPFSGLTLVAQIFVLLSPWWIIVCTSILLQHKDVGLKMAGWASALLAWAMVVGWRVQGNMLMLYLFSINTPDAPSPLWWFSASLCITALIIPLGLLWFLARTLQLIYHEVADE